MISKFTTMTFFCMAMAIIFVLGTQGEISITSEPEKITKHSLFTLTCYIGKLTDEVRWICKGITRFSCASPYSAGLCLINTKGLLQNYSSPTYDINTTAGLSTVDIYMDDNDLGGLWTCQHGSDSSTYNVSYVDFDRRASITSFTSSPSSSNINVGTTITFTCTVSSTTLLPVNVSISSEKREGNLTYVINSSSRTFTVSTVAQCIDYRFYCRAYNGYGTVASTTLYKHVKCPVKLLHDKTNTTVNATVGSSGFFYAYYSGYPGSSYTWYRRLSDDEVEMSSYRTNWSLNYGCRYIRLQIVNVRLQDAGQYSVHINASGKVFIVRFKLNVNPVPISNSVTEEQLSDIQPFISAAGFGIGIAVGVIITLLVQGVVLLVSRILKSRDDKDKGVKPKRL